MGRSLGLAAYRALTRRQPVPQFPTETPRPDGELIWAHVDSELRYSALCDLCLRLRATRPDVYLLVTVSKSLFGELSGSSGGCDFIFELAGDHPTAAKQFLEHWKPDLCLWVGGELMPNLISETSEKGIPMILLDISESDLPQPKRLWLPDLTRAVLNCFDVILTNGETVAEVIQKVGVTEPKISVTGQLRNSAMPPACSEEELAEVMIDLASRPVWLAAHVHNDEYRTVVAAHRTALRLVHRLLLILVVDQSCDVDVLKEHMAEANLRSIDWDIGDMIEDHTQVVISRDEDNLGLWYRVAPLTFLGGSLTAGSTGNRPFEASALGSAVLYGPHVSKNIEAYARLAAAGAARTIRDEDGLGSAVIQLVAPDHAASMALAGWKVVTESAHLTDNLVDLILDFLDLRGVSHATA